jgi:RNA polymerase sigma factor (sigma-70 family)
MTSPPHEEGQNPALLTTFHVRRAREGSETSIEWLVNRFAPLLRAQAEYRLQKTLRSLYDPEDLVQDVWAVTLPKLRELAARDDRYTPVLLKFLSTTLLLRVKGLVEKHLKGKPARLAGEEGNEALEQLAAESTGASSRLARREVRDQITVALDRLEAKDRELIVLRGIEQHAYKEIAVLLRADAKSLAVRYQRALEKLRRELPGSIYEELEAD